MSRTTTTKPSAISAEMVIRALQDATPTAYATRDDMHRDTWTTEHQARALVYLCSETADATPQEYWEEQQFNADGIREQRHCGILPGDHDIRARIESTRHAVQLATDAAAAELRAFDADRFIRIRIGERSSIKIMNTRERIAEMVATVRRSPSLFGGGPVEKPAKARPAASWKPRSVAMVWEMLQDGDAAGALDLADTMGAMFYLFGSYGNWCGMTWAPLPVDGMPAGFVSARRCDGQWTVFHAGSMLTMNGNGKPTSRAKAEQVARELWNSKTEDQQAHALQAAANSPQDQAEARAAWIKLHSITTEAETTQHDETTGPTEMVNIISELTGAVMATVPREKAEELAAMIGTTVQAARQVSELIANATTAAAIEHASEQPTEAQHQDEADDARELATVDACSEPDALATTCDASSAGNAGSAPTHGRASSAAHQAPAAPTFQTITGKSGNWCARFRLLSDGAPVLEFSTRPDDWSIQIFSNGRDRMAALQAMARQADQAAQDTDDQDDQQTERERRLNAFDAMTATAADVQAMGAEYVAQLLDDLEDINYHTEGLILQALAAGREDLADRARANLREHLRAGHLTEALRIDRQAISETLRQSTKQRAYKGLFALVTKRQARELWNSGEPIGLLTYKRNAPFECDTMNAEYKAFSSFDEKVTDAESQLRSGERIYFYAPAEHTGYTPPAPDHHQQTAPVPNHTDEVPRAVGADSGPASNPPGATAPSAPAPSAPAPSAPAPSAPAPDTEASADEPEPEFTRTAPQPFDMLAMIAAGLAPADFVGLGIVYSGDRANPSGCGAITDVEPCSWYKYTVTVTLEDGRQSRLNPVSFTDHLGNRYRTNFKRHGAPYLAELSAARLAVEAADKAAKQAAADEKDRQRRELPQQWPQLKAYDPAGKLSGCTLAAANIRILLKEKFPGIKFSVKTSKFSGGDDINVSWTDGPAQKDVEAIADLFSAGSFDGMEDIYNYRRSVFTDLFGDSKYIFCNRDISPELLAQAIADEWPNPQGRPSVEDYQKARGAFDFIDQKGNRRRIEERLNRMGWNFKS